MGTGNDCFKWEVLAGLHPASDDPSLMENFVEYISDYDFSSLCFPVPLSSIAPLAAKNGISINVYAVEDGKRVNFPLCVTDNVVPGNHIDLLLHEMGGIQHCSALRNFSRLISGQMSIHEYSIYCCKKCPHAYSSVKLLEEHSLNCCHVQRTKFPKDPRCRFTNVQKQLPAPFVVYAVFVPVLEPLSDIDTTQGVAVGTEYSVTPYQEHVACSFGYKIVSSVVPDFNKPIVWYRGPGAAEEFVRELQREAEEICAENIETPQEMEFPPKSVDVLSKPLADDEFKYLVETGTTGHFDLIRRKGVYPYDYMDSFKGFDETDLPSQEEFFNKLSGGSCSDADYEHATCVWEAFNCETMGDYLQLDVLLLADLFEKFRRTCIDFYKLYPLH